MYAAPSTSKGASLAEARSLTSLKDALSYILMFQRGESSPSLIRTYSGAAVSKFCFNRGN